jgi:hypothetical protein
MLVDRVKAAAHLLGVVTNVGEEAQPAEFCDDFIKRVCSRFVQGAVPFFPLARAERIVYDCQVICIALVV